jgi:2-polyprenyl-3-methyl-5-hydroxy-6-metoxy-1,4-benzoquinol methylase
MLRIASSLFHVSKLDEVEGHVMSENSKISQDSISYWDACFWIDGPVQKTSDAFNDAEVVKQHIKEYWEFRNKMRWDSVITGEIYYKELLAIDLKGLQVLDFGCGMGVDSFYMSQAGANVTAVDIVPANVQLVSKILEGSLSKAVLLKEYDDIDQLGMFDLILLDGCLQHIQTEKIQHVVELFKRHLKPGGMFLCMVYTTTYYPHENACGEGPYTRGYTIEQLQALLGLKLECYRIFNRNSYMWAKFTKENEYEMIQSIDVRQYQAIGSMPPPGGVGPICSICGQSMWVELGGGNSNDAYHPNVDVRAIPGVDIICDLSKGVIPLHDGHADKIKMIHLINHLSAEAGEKILNECLRILRPGGSLFIMVTDMGFVLKRIIADGMVDEWTTCVWGTRGNTYDADFHLWGYTESSLELLLKKVGFVDISRLGHYNAWEFKMQAMKGK